MEERAVADDSHHLVSQIGLRAFGRRVETLSMPCAMLMLAPMQVWQCWALYGGNAPMV